MTPAPLTGATPTAPNAPARSHRVLYASLAVPIAAGAPLGWLLISLIRRGELRQPFAWATNELSEHALLYAYLEVSTTIVLMVLGWTLGRLTDRLERDALTDPLTGLYNRRYLETRLAEEMARARRHGSALALVLIDIDNFKSINDARGHDTGDTVLKRLSTLIQAEVRESDIAARPAGDEFVVLLPHADGTAARSFCERLRAHAAAKLDGTTLSIGAGLFLPEVHTTPRDFFRDVDRALYGAKQGGKNRVQLSA